MIEPAVNYEQSRSVQLVVLSHHLVVGVLCQRSVRVLPEVFTVYTRKCRRRRPNVRSVREMVEQRTLVSIGGDVAAKHRRDESAAHSRVAQPAKVRVSRVAVVAVELTGRQQCRWARGRRSRWAQSRCRRRAGLKRSGESAAAAQVGAIVSGETAGDIGGYIYIYIYMANSAALHGLDWPPPTGLAELGSEEKVVVRRMKTVVCVAQSGKCI